MSDYTTIGIDVSKHFLDICILPTGETMHIANNKYGYKKIVTIFSKYENIFRIVMEHTGGYQKNIAEYLIQKGFPVSVVNPIRIRYFAKANGKRAKTDIIDALILAQYGLIHKPELTKNTDHNLEELRQMVHRRANLVEMLTAERNSLEKNPGTAETKSIKHIIDVLEKEIQKITLFIRERIKNNPELKRKSEILQTVSGIGAECAALLVSEVPELGKVSRRQIAALIGLAPINRDSGMKKGHAFIQGGRRNVRCSLYMPTVVASTQCNPVLKEYYNRLVVNGKPKKVAIIACMRKLVIYLNSLLAKNF